MLERSLDATGVAASPKNASAEILRTVRFVVVKKYQERSVEEFANDE